MTKVPLLSCLLACGLVAPAAAQQTNDAPETRDEVVVEGSRLNQSITELGSSVSIITGEEIDARGFDFVLDALASAPGVTINQNGSFGGQASVRIRGASSEQTLVLIDGVPVNDPSTPGGGFNFARLDTENIARIEILKGPQSTLWGTDAIGGVVSITTKTPPAGLAASAFGEYGSFDTIRGGGSASYSEDLGDFRIAASTVSSDGISKADSANGNTENDPYDSLTLSAKGGLNLPADARLEGAILWTDADSAFDSFTIGAQGNVGDGNEVSETEELTGHIALHVPLFNGKLENTLFFGHSEISRENFNNGVSSFAAEGERQIYRYQGTLNIADGHTLAFGAEREDTESRGEGTQIDSLFGLYELQPADGLTITGGVRMDDHEEFGTEVTGRAAIAYQASRTVTLRASWGQGFKAPTIFQTTFFCCGATEPNATLRPETSEAFDLGVDWRASDGSAEVSVTYFNQQTEDLIDFAMGSYFNVEEVDAEGVEVSGRYDFTDWLSLSANYSFISATETGNQRRTRLPRHSAELVADIDPAGPFAGSILVRYNGNERNTNGTTLNDWVRVDLSGSYQVTEEVKVFARIENLFDEQYQQILGYGTPGISGSVGVRLSY